MMIDRRLIDNFDWRIPGVVLAIAGIGVFTLYTTGSSEGSIQGTPVYLKQVYWLALGVLAFLAALALDYHTLIRYGYAWYGASLVLLVWVLLAGRMSQGAQRWIPLGPFSFQPSELAKLGLLFALVKYFADRPRHAGIWHRLILPSLLWVVPAALILKQPDLGTGLVVTFLFVVTLYLVGLRYRSLVFLLVCSLMAFPFAWHLFWQSLKEYQRERILTFLNPAADPLGTGYHILQSKIAIGSGGWFGKGPFGGTQSQLKFLPEGHTDFIFPVFAEEWGFLGVVILGTLYLLLVLWGLEVALKAKDTGGMLLAAGVVAFLSCYVLVNIGMTVGMMPVVGIPLPLMSYGGTSMVVTLISVGILMNVQMRRFMLFY